jgi:hypothetical protein
LDNFDDRYLGPKATAPTVDNDGNALIIGALYFDTTTGKMRVFTSSGWLDASSASVATLATFEFIATNGQTTFSGNDANGQALAYTVGALIVSLNGVILQPGDDYTASSGSSIVLVSGAAAGDELTVYAFGNFLVADTYSRAEANTLLAGKLNDTGIDSMTAGAGQGAGIEFAGNGNTVAGSTSFFVGQGSTGDGFVYQRANLPLNFGTNNQNRMTLRADGTRWTNSNSLPAFECRAWVNFNGTTSPGTIRASGNVSSVTRTSNGVYVVNFATAMPDANYAVTTDGLSTVFDQVCAYENAATGSVGIKVQDGSAGTFINISSVSVAIFR